MSAGAFGPSTSRGGRGWPIFALLLDELAHMVDIEGSNIAAETVYRALVPATAQFSDDARVIASSTPWGSDGLFAELYQRADSGELEGALAQHSTTAEANPTVESSFLDAEEARDRDGFKSEYLAQFVGSGSAFFDLENVAASVTLACELRPADAESWVAGLDPAFSSDPFGLVLVGRDRRDPGRLLVGAVRSWQPPRRKAGTLEEGRQLEDAVLAEVAGVLRAFDARAITDQYRSAGVTERLRRYGISVRSEAMTAPTKDASFGFLRGRINEGGIELPEHPDLLRELRAIRTRYSAGRSSVVLPRIGGSHCDLAQALAIAVFEHDRRSLNSGPTMSVPSGLVQTRRFRDDEPNLHPDAVASGSFARERLAARSPSLPGCAGTCRAVRRSACIERARSPSPCHAAASGAWSFAPYADEWLDRFTDELGDLALGLGVVGTSAANVANWRLRLLAMAVAHDAARRPRSREIPVYSNGLSAWLSLQRAVSA